MQQHRHFDDGGRAAWLAITAKAGQDAEVYVQGSLHSGTVVFLITHSLGTGSSLMQEAGL